MNHTGEVPLEKRDVSASWRFVVLASIAYLAVVLFVVSRHEYWRDEVRAHSVAMQSSGLVGLWQQLGYEGHPIVWYLILRAAAVVLPATLVLPVCSVGIALLAVAIFLKAAPFPRWLKLLFVAGAFPLYEYAVFARNYGIGMLAIFCWCLAYPQRWRRSWLVGCALAVVANTSIHGAIIAMAILIAWFAEYALARRAGTFEKRLRDMVAGAGIAIVGVVTAVLAVRVPADSVLYGRTHDLLPRVVSAAPVLLHPGRTFPSLFAFLPVRLEQMIFGPSAAVAARAFGVLSTLFVVAVLVDLARRRSIHALAFGIAVCGFAIFFEAIYLGYLRHQGLIFILAVALYWVARLDDARRPTSPRYVVLGAACALQVMLGLNLIRIDVTRPMSPSRDFAEWLRVHPAYASAVLIGDPPYILEAMPHYVTNQLYFPREQRFARFSGFKSTAIYSLRLSALLDSAETVAHRTRSRVLIVLGASAPFSTDSSPPVTQTGPRRMEAQPLTWNVADRKRWNAETEMVAAFPEAELEQYWVFRLRSDSTSAAR